MEKIKNIFTPGKTYSLRKRIMITCIVILFVPSILVGGYGFYLYKNNIEELSLQYSRQILLPTKQQIEDIFKKFDSSLVPIWLQDDLQKLATIPSDQWQEEPRLVISVKKRIDEILGWQQNVNGLFIITRDNGLLFNANSFNINTSHEFEQEPFFQESGKVKDSFISGPRMQTYSTNRPVFSITRSLRILPNYEWKGAIHLDIDADEIFDVLDNVRIGESGLLLVLDNHNRVIYHPDKELLGENYTMDFIKDIDRDKGNGSILVNHEGVETIITYEHSSFLDWTFIGIVPAKEINQGAFQITSVILVVTGVSLIIILIIFWNVTSTTLKPIRKINDAIKNLGFGNFTHKLESSKIVELDPIVSQYNLTVDRLDQLTNKLYHSILKQNKLELEAQRNYLLRQEAELRQREAELGELHAQINPHFLNNTLSSIQSLAELEEYEKIDRVVGLLSKLLNFGVRSEKSVVRLKDELEHVKVFVDIQEIRHEDKIQVIWDIDNTLYEWEIYRLTIQPLVENAFFHGVEPKLTQGNIRITVQRKGNYGEIVIEDDGVGMKDRKVKELNTFIDKYTGKTDFDAENSKERLSGLKNIIKRLLIIYGSRCHIEIVSKLEQGTKIKIKIKLDQGELKQ